MSHDRHHEAGAERRKGWLVRWLTQELRRPGAPRTDFARLCEHVQPADILLLEGRTRVAGIIQSVTMSTWSHAALYIGRAEDVTHDKAARIITDQGWPGQTQLLLEADTEAGVQLTPMARYQQEHLRICRPSELLAEDRAQVIGYSLERLGTPYDLRQIVDMFRFLLPYGLMPRHWRSTLFATGRSDAVQVICSTLLANAFASARYPILPSMHRGKAGQVVFHHRNSRLITPADFDTSPYFDIIKFPFFGDDVQRYRQMIWEEDEGNAVYPQLPARPSLPLRTLSDARPGSPDQKPQQQEVKGRGDGSTGQGHQPAGKDTAQDR